VRDRADALGTAVPVRRRRPYRAADRRQGAEHRRQRRAVSVSRAGAALPRPRQRGAGPLFRKGAAAGVEGRAVQLVVQRPAAPLSRPEPVRSQDAKGRHRLSARQRIAAARVCRKLRGVAVLMQTIQANGAELHVAVSGPDTGPAVVFANSLGTDLRVWDALIPHLAPGLRLVRYDKRGHGLSEETPGPYSIETLADDAAALIAALGLGRVVFVGLSIGGLIGLSLAARHPGLLAGLVVSNSAARIGDAAMWNARIAAIRKDGLASIAAPTMERWFSPAFRAAGHDAVWARMLSRQPQGGYVACCQAIAGADL